MSDGTFFCCTERALYFRVLGYGLHFSTRYSRPCFSERFGLGNVLYLFGVRIEWLKPQ